MIIHFTNPQYLDLVKGFDNRMSALGQTWQLVRTQELFHAIPTRLPPIDPALALGSDWRQEFTLEVKRAFSPDIKYGDVILQVDPASNTTIFQKFPLAKVVKREDNPADPIALRFGCVRVPDEEADATFAQLNTSQADALAAAQP